MDNSKEEREFLHDLATPLATALYLTDSLLDSLKEEGRDPTQIENIVKALETLRLLLENRRDTIVQRGLSKTCQT